MTPHTIVLVDSQREVITEFPSKGIIRLSQTTQTLDHLSVDGINIPITKTIYGGTTFPAEASDVYHIVSGLVKSAFPDQPNLLVPSELVRDHDGRVIGCLSLGV